MPMPVPVANICNSNPQVCSQYQTKLSQGLTKAYAVAIQSWEDVVKANAISPWTETAEERLYDHDPVKYPPPQHAPVVPLTDAP